MSGEPSAPSQPEGTGRPVETTPLFRIDPGWPFVISGLALIVSAVMLVPLTVLAASIRLPGAGVPRT